MKKLLALLLALTMVFALAACGSSSDTSDADSDAAASQEAEAPEAEAEPEAEPEAESYDLIVFAAASMTETMEEIKDLYEAEHPEVNIIYTFDSSGTLKTQIEEGADCDIFISAAQKQMNQLDITDTTGDNTDGLDFVLSETRINLVENKCALAVPEGNPAGIESYDQLFDLLRTGDVFLAVGNEDVPVGQYTECIFDYYGLSMDDVSSCLTYGSNVKEVTTAVSENTCDCGIIYGTDAYSAGLQVVEYATSEMAGGDVIYPAAVLNITSNQEGAQQFLDYLTTDTCVEIFESVGFVMAG